MESKERRATGEGPRAASILRYAGARLRVRRGRARDAGSRPPAPAGMGMLGLLLFTLLQAAPLLGQAPGHAVEPLVHSARAAIAEIPTRFAPGEAARLAVVQARLGDVVGARETARTVGLDSWVPHARIASVQRDLGDHVGALETTRLVPGFMDRAQAMGSLASGYIHSDLDRAEWIIRQIEWPKQQIEGLIALANHVRGDPDRAQAYLREAVRVAGDDPSSWGHYFRVELAYRQVRHGDLADALRILSDSVPVLDRTERMARIAIELQRWGGPRGQAVADSLFREALLLADRVPADAQPSPEAIRERVFRFYRSSFSPASRETMLSESRSEAERTQALIDLVAGGAFSSENLDRHREAVRELEMRGEHGAAARGLAGLLLGIVLGDGGAMVEDHELPSEADALVDETLRLAHLHGGALPDSLRFRIVRTIGVPPVRWTPHF
jgi:hypothetical protein